VSPKRGDRAAPPPGPGEWDVRFGTTEAANGWDVLCKHASGALRTAWALLRSNPRPPIDSRHAPLKHDLATKTVQGHVCEQWQYEVTGGGRIWYAVDDDRRTVWITVARIGHPPQTG
jgi:hypothetical protein